MHFARWVDHGDDGDIACALVIHCVVQVKENMFQETVELHPIIAGRMWPTKNDRLTKASPFQ